MADGSEHVDSMSSGPTPSAGETPFPVYFHLLGTLPFEDFLPLQRRLMYEAEGDADGRITVLLCEHPAMISVGRGGSRGHIRLTSDQLRSRRLRVRWVGRGGGCLLHGPGQIAVYPIVPLRWHGWTLGDYLRRLQAGLERTLEQLAVKAWRIEPHIGLWGRSGQLVSWGIAVRNWVTGHGAYIQVHPMTAHSPFVDVVDPVAVERGQKSTMGCLFAERRRAMTVAKVRASLIPTLAAALGTDHYHMMTGHPLLREMRRTQRESRNRAS